MVEKILSKLFFQDVKMLSLTQFWRLAVRSIILTTIATFWIIAILDDLPNYDFNVDEEILIFFIAALALLFGGILTDILIRKKFSFEIIAFMGILCIILMLNMKDESFIKILSFFLGIISSLLLIMLITFLLLETSMLNRARITTLLVLLMGILTTPIISIIIIFENDDWVWLLVLVSVIFSVILSIKFPRERMFAKKEYVKDEIGLENWIKTLSSSGAIPYFIFLFFISLTVGFLMSDSVAENVNTAETITMSLVGALSLPIIAVVLDKFGRKPIGYVMLFLMGTQAMFFNYPDTTLLSLDELKIGIFGFTIILILTLTVVMSGDLSSVFSRGKIIGVLLFATVIGALIGTTGRLMFFNNIDFINANSLTKISTWATFIIFISTFMFAATKEPLEEDNSNWRHYLKKMYLISKFGVSLYSVDFSGAKINSKIINEDLVSGGLIGIQAMLKEISQSKKKINVVDHGDLKIIFNYGEFTNVILFATKDLKVYHEKLEGFRLRAEYYNKDLLIDFNGNISALRDLQKLSDRYFK